MVKIKFRIIHEDPDYSYIDSVEVPESKVEETIQHLEKQHHEIMVCENNSELPFP